MDTTSRARRLRTGLLVAGSTVVAISVPFLLRAPSASRAWAEDQARLPSIELGGGAARIEGLRDFVHDADGVSEMRYADRTIALGDVRRVWLALAPFADRFRGLAHTFLSFEMADGSFLAVSVEARREVDESYSLVGGVLRGFEVAYVIGTEEDLIGLRALRGDEIYLYPTVATPGQARAILEDVLRRARRTQEAPEFYNTLWNNCATNLRDHVNRVTDADLPWGWGVLLPGFADAWALEQGLLDTELDLPAARVRFRADERARAALAEGASDFSAWIRSGGGPG